MSRSPNPGEHNRKPPGSLAQWVAEVVAEHIGEGRYQEGQRLPENQLAAELGVSRSPIREGLRLLEQDGLITISPRKGAVVAEFTEKMVDEIYQCRMHLATLGVSLAVPNLSAADVEHLRGLLRRMEEAVAAGDVQAYSRPNREFHNFLYERAGNEVLRDLLRALGRRVRRQRYVSLSLPTRAQASLEGHRRLMRAIEKGSAEQAGQIAAQTIAEAWKALRNHLRSDSTDGFAAQAAIPVQKLGR